MDAHAFLRGNPKNIAHGRVYYVPRSESKIHSLAKLNKKKMLSFSTWVHLSRYNNHWWICTLTTFSHIFQRPSLKIVLANKKFIANFEMCVPYAIGKERWLTLAYSIPKKNHVILLGQPIAFQCVCVFFPFGAQGKIKPFLFVSCYSSLTHGEQPL
jgi:hypothetical protein